MSRTRNAPITKDDTRRMEEEAKRMECKMEALRRVMDPKDSKAGTGGEGRWRSATANKPLTRGYVKDVLEAPGKTRRSANACTERRNPDSTLLPKQGGNLEEPHGSARGSRAGSGAATPVHASAQGAIAEFASTGGVVDSKPRRSACAARNLQAAMQQQSEDATEVERFLVDLKLDRYVSLFYDNGFDCMEVVQEMDESHMRDIGMAPGHIIKLKKHLAELKPSPPASVGSSTRASANPAAGTAARGEGGGSLLDGPCFDEAAAAASFQEAVRAWREGGDAKGAADEKSVAGAAQSTPKAGGSFWSTVGGGEVDLVRASTPLGSVPKELCLTGVAPGVATQAGEEQGRPGTSQGEDKLCCYQCYKQFFAKHLVERTSPLPGNETRRLCSEACANIFTAAAEVKAQALEKRRQQIEKMKEIQRVIEVEKTSVGEEGASTAGVDAALPTAAVA